MSYRDSLLGELSGAYEQAFFGSAMEDDLVSSDEEEDPPEDGEVVISIPRETKLRIRAPWSTSFIVKVFGRSVGYLFLVNRLKSLWKPIGGFSCVDLGLGFFLVKLDLADDFDRILKGGPWFIGEHFLSLRPWVPDFRPSETSVNTVAVWVRLPELPVEYYDKESLLLIGHALGPVLRVDFNTASGNRGRFARLCIQLDLDKPLIKTIRVGKVKQAVIYEGIGLLCFHCGRIGHKLDKCPERGRTTPLAPTAPAHSDAPPPTNSPARDAESTFGPWMLSSLDVNDKINHNVTILLGLAEDNSVVTLAPGRAAQTNKDGNASTSSPEKTKQAPQFRWKSSANPNPKGKAVKLPHNPNGASNSTVISRPFCLDNSSERQSRALGRGDYRDDSSGPATHLGLVPDRDGTSVAKYSSSRDLQRLSRSPSPRRLSLASREQPVLELSLRSAENSRGQQCTEEALSTISGAKIVSISGGGSLSNATRMVHREDSASLSTHQPELGRQSSFSGLCTDSQMCPRILNDHQELRDERNKLSSVSTQHEGSEERNMGNVARDGLECHGGDRELAPTN
uniref:CCHC-type domain-containing protein n=1 Tax=Fagus sylvatica TaxID=28930 RepID=A0A2N9HPR9_FAGSY